MENVTNLIELIFKDKENNLYLWESLKNILHKNKEEITNFCNIMKLKINSGNKDDILFAFNLVDFAVDYGSIFLWEKIDSLDFLSVIVNIIKNNPDQDLQSVCLYLINKLAEKFKNFSNLQNSVNIFKNLKKSNINCPNSLKHSYMDILKKSKKNNITTNNNNQINANQNQNNQFQTEYKVTKRSRIPTKPEDYKNNINFDLNENNYDPKYKKLVNKLNETINLIQEINILINQNTNLANNEKIEGLINDLKENHSKIVNCLQRHHIKVEILNICVKVIGDIVMTFNRHDKLKKGENPGQFLTNFSRDDNPYCDKKNKIENKNKTVVINNNASNKLNELGFRDTVKTIYLNDGNNVMENSFNALFGKKEKTEILDSNDLNQKRSDIKNFTSMSNFSNDEGDNNQSNNFLKEDFNLLNNSHVMIIGNKIINNNINNNNQYNNGIANQNFIENQGNRRIFNNFLLNNNNNINNIGNPNQQNNNNFNNPYRSHMMTNYPNNINFNNNINNIQQNNNTNNNINNNNFYNNQRNLSRTQFVVSHANLNNFK